LQKTHLYPTIVASRGGSVRVYVLLRTRALYFDFMASYQTRLDRASLKFIGSISDVEKSNHGMSILNDLRSILSLNRHSC